MNRFWAKVSVLVVVGGLAAWDFVWPPLPAVGIAGALGYLLGYYTKKEIEGES